MFNTWATVVCAVQEAVHWVPVAHSFHPGLDKLKVLRIESPDWQGKVPVLLWVVHVNDPGEDIPHVYIVVASTGNEIDFH